MDALKSFLGLCAVTSQLPNETDVIYPLHMLDDIKTVRNIICTWTLRFNDVLDADKLHTSLSSLFQIGDWRKVGGRLMLNEKGELKIRVPEKFTSECPPVSYTHEDLAMAIAEHPLAKELPTTTDTLSIQAGADKFQQFAVSKGAPETLEDYLKQDIPILSLHVTSFRDATLVGLSWPHALMDVMGQQALLHAWSLVLAARISDVPPVLGAHEDVIRATLDDSPKGEDFIMGQRQLKGWSMVKFGLNYAWDLLRGPAPEVHSIFLPQRVMAEMRRRAEDDLAVDEASVNEKHFISDGDILTAWATQAVARSLPKSRPVTVFQVLNARFRLPSLIQASGVYIQNMVVAGFTLLSPQAASGPLGHIALENRRCLREQATEGQVLALLRQLRQQLNKSKDPNILCGETDAVLLCVSNWGRADMFKAADFGPAVIRAGKQGAQRSNPPGTIVYHHAGSMRRLVGLGNLFLMLGKDHGGNYWLSGTLPPSTWEAIKENTII